MFKRIVSQLSLSPSVAQNLNFYARRLKQESVTRTFSVIAAVLLVGLQLTVVTAPPTASNAASPNDVIYGGFTSKADLLAKYDGSAELQALYNYFGISRVDLAGTAQATINSRDHTLSSLGRMSEGIGYATIVAGGTTFWAHHLYQFDTGSNVQNGSTYSVLWGVSAKTGQVFAVMFACGNLVFRSLPTPPAPPPPPPPPPPVVPPKPVLIKSLACVYLNGSASSGTTPLTVSFRGSGMSQNEAITHYVYNFGDGTSLTTGLVTTASHTYTKAGTFVATLQIVGTTGTTAVIPVCSFTVKTVTAAALTSHKSALNVTQNIDATTKPAAAGDTIKYSLIENNSGGTSAPYTFSDDFTSVLQYADVVSIDGGGVVKPGASTGLSNIVWPATTIPAGNSITRTVVVKVKNPIPVTSVGSSDPKSFNLQMINQFGNVIVIPVTPPAPKKIETAAAQLPDTGAGTSTAIVLAFCALVAYFYARNRQLMAEIRILHGDYQGGNQ